MRFRHLKYGRVSRREISIRNIFFNSFYGYSFSDGLGLSTLCYYSRSGFQMAISDRRRNGLILYYHEKHSHSTRTSSNNTAVLVAKISGNFHTVTVTADEIFIPDRLFSKKRKRQFKLCCHQLHSPAC
jgi:hypothetical protein